MDNRDNFLFHLKFDDDYKPFVYNENLENLKKAYILCKDSFNDKNINISNLVHNKLNTKILNIPRLNFSLAEIMSFKKKKSDFYILSEGWLENIFKKKGININYETNIFFEDKIEYKLLYFGNVSSSSSEYLYFKIKNNQPVDINNQTNNFPMNNNNINQNNNQIINIKNTFDNNNNILNNNIINNNITNNNNINNINIINQTSQSNDNYPNNYFNFQNDENRSKIISILILLYGNEKITMELYSKGFYDLKNCYLVNKSWIYKFKEKYFYNEISDILKMKGINTYQDALKNLKSFETSKEILDIINKINIQANTLIQNELSLETKNFEEFNCPINFEIINDKLLNLIMENPYSTINSDYEISFGKSSLYLRWKYDLNKIYYYNYGNNTFNLEGIIELLGDLCKEIYDRKL